MNSQVLLIKMTSSLLPPFRPLRSRCGRTNRKKLKRCGTQLRTRPCGKRRMNRQHIFLRLVDEFTPLHLRVLALFDNPADEVAKTERKFQVTIGGFGYGDSPLCA